MTRATHFLATSAAVLASITLSACGDPSSAEQKPPVAYAEPEEIVVNDTTKIELHYRPGAVEIDGRQFCLRTYNGLPNGPTLRVPKGANRKIHVSLKNEFTRSDYREIAAMMGTSPHSCHDFNLTNLHGHGLHVQPNYATADAADQCTGNGCAADMRYYGDNVLLSVNPGESAQYRWDIDEDGAHHEGTDWYHPHIHGSTAIQVMDGVAGALIIEGPLDEIKEIKNAKERVMVMTQVAIDHANTVPLKDGEECTEDNLSVTDFLAVETPRSTLINGKLKPRLKTPPNQVERWRMVYAGSPDEIGIKLHAAKDAQCDNFDLMPIETTQIARDGITLPQFYKSDTLWFSPGYRIDVMMKMPAQKQTLCLVARRVSEPLGKVVAILDVDESAGAPTETNLPNEADVQAVAPKTTWTSMVDGQTTEVNCDTIKQIHQKLVLLAPTPGEAPPLVGQDAVLTSCTPKPYEIDPNAPVCLCPAPNISCRSFEDRRGWGYRSDRIATVNTSERWQIRAFDGHPFHIHINPFLVCANTSNKEPNFPHFRDTMWVQLEDGPRDIVLNFSKFTGQFVTHCHKLNHEDEGMMELVEICDPNDTNCLCQGMDAMGNCIPQSGCKAEDKQCQYAKTVTDAYPAPPPPNPALCGP